jgi:hypothetical protein
VPAVCASGSVLPGWLQSSHCWHKCCSHRPRLLTPELYIQRCLYDCYHSKEHQIGGIPEQDSSHNFILTFVPCRVLLRSQVTPGLSCPCGYDPM